MEMAGPPGTLPDAFCPELLTSLHLPPVSHCGCSSPRCSTSREERVGEAGGPSPLPFLGGDPPPPPSPSHLLQPTRLPDPGIPTGCVRSHSFQWSLLGCLPSSAGARRAQAWGICTEGEPQAGVLGAEPPPEPGFPLCPVGKPPSALLGETSHGTGWALGSGGLLLSVSLLVLSTSRALPSVCPLTCPMCRSDARACRGLGGWAWGLFFVLCHLRWSYVGGVSPKSTRMVHPLEECTHSRPGAPTTHIHIHRRALPRWSVAFSRHPLGLQQEKDSPEPQGQEGACIPGSSQLWAKSLTLPPVLPVRSHPWI